MYIFHDRCEKLRALMERGDQTLLGLTKGCIKSYIDCV